MTQRPIVIASTGRCGSSLVAGIFAAHGVWMGDCQAGDEFNPDGYFENLRFKHTISGRIHSWARSLVSPDPDWRAFAEGVLRKGGYSGGPWAVKHNVIAWPLWEDFSPVWVLPRRNLDAVFRSVRRAGFSRRLTDEQLRAALVFMGGQMDFLRDERGGLEISSDALVAGDFSSLEVAMRAAGIEPDRSIIASRVRQEVWGRA